MIRLRAYTLIELVIVLIIIGLLSAVVLSRFAESPKRLAVDGALNDIRRAFSETAMAARASGAVKALIVNPDSREMTVADVTDDLNRAWKPNPFGSSANADGGNVVYPLPDSVEWDSIPEMADYDGIVGIRYLFFPDGQAAGDDVAFSIKGRRFFWSVDRILGRVVIYEEE